MDFYIQASKILVKLDNKAGSIKGLTLQNGEKNGPRTYALILETLKYRDVLEQIIKKSDLLGRERKLAAQGPLALVLVHDLLLNKSGIVANAGPFKDAVMRHKTRLHAEWIKAKIRLKVKDNVDLAKVDDVFMPRWARINTLKRSKQDMLAALSEFKTVKRLEDLSKDCVYIDEHIENLLAFHPQASLGNHQSYLDGSLIFQNKASCIPAAVLAPPRGSTVIDACAAPGNKTSHIAALLASTGKVFAFERDNKRVGVLREMLSKAGAQVDVTHGDFTRADPLDPKYAGVTHLLLDPSCSGSGIVNRLDYLTAPSGALAQPENAETDTAIAGTAVDRDRLDSLASFQLALLLHAMRFPAASRITYSTCSVHAVENERVVMAALKRAPDWEVAPRWDALPTWPTRGIAAECEGDVDIAEGLIRAEPGAMGTIGFFVACFVRRQPAASGDVAEASHRLFVPSEDEGQEADGGEVEAAAAGTSVGTLKKRKKRQKKRPKRQKTAGITGDGSGHGHAT